MPASTRKVYQLELVTTAGMTTSPGVAAAVKEAALAPATERPPALPHPSLESREATAGWVARRLDLNLKTRLSGACLASGIGVPSEQQTPPRTPGFEPSTDDLMTNGL